MTLYDQFAHDFKDKKILIFGLGLLGSSVGVAIEMAKLGCPLRITDLKSADQLQPSLNKLNGLRADYVLGEHREADIAWADVIIRSAAVPNNHPLLTLARRLHKPVHMDTELFVLYATGVTTIGVTGTRGKSTTTQLIYTILQQSGRPVLLGGNVKDTATLPLLATLTDPTHTLAVLELSSWQLQAFRAAALSPRLAVLTNLYPDHLNVYPSLTKYYQDKQAIYESQSLKDAVFFNAAIPEFHLWATTAPGHVFWYQSADVPPDWHPLLSGSHNRQNLAAALAVGRYLKVPDQSLQSTLEHFTTLPYRLEPIRTVNGVTFINDTTSTTPTATQVALQTVSPPITLILGGSDKKLPLTQLAAAVNAQVKHVILLSGSGTDRLKPLLNSGLIDIETGNLKAAVDYAFRHSVPGTTVLFSPGFTSFGLFTNEFHRGDVFNQLVDAL